MRVAGRVIALLAFAILLPLSPVLAQKKAPVKKATQQQEAEERSGFWFRGNLGGGSALYSSDPLDVSGGAAMVSLSFGKFLNDDLVIYGDIHGSVISGPTLETPGGASVDTDDDVTASVGGVGIGLGYYLIPNSLFLGGAVGIQTMRMEQESTSVEGETDPGFGASVILGKDWVISDKWTLGAAGHLLMGTMEDQGGGPTWTARAVGLSFTFSYASDAWRR